MASSKLSVCALRLPSRDPAAARGAVFLARTRDVVRRARDAAAMRYSPFRIFRKRGFGGMGGKSRRDHRLTLFALYRNDAREASRCQLWKSCNALKIIAIIEFLQSNRPSINQRRWTGISFSPLGGRSAFLRLTLFPLGRILTLSQIRDDVAPVVFFLHTPFAHSEGTDRDAGLMHGLG